MFSGHKATKKGEQIDSEVSNYVYNATECKQKGLFQPIRLNFPGL